MDDSPFLPLPRFSLSGFPTPLHRLESFAATIPGAPELWIKRDDLTSLAMGGNKVRKLEFLLADAIANGAETLVTAGGVQSNHCRLTAAAAARAGLACHLVLGGARAAATSNGNLLLDELCGATLHFVAKSGRAAKMEALGEELGAAGRRPYLIPVGGSNGLGATGYAHALFAYAEEFADEARA